MNIKFFNRTAIVGVLVLSLAACSSQDDETSAPAAMSGDTPAEEYVYTMQMDATAPAFADEETGATRATTSWANGSKLYLRFSSGSQMVTGTATYSTNTGLWTVTANSSLAVTSEAAACEVYYFENASAKSDGTLSLSESSVAYTDKAATYSHPNTSELTVTARLTPYTWRLRFKGTSGATVTMPTLGNSINYFTVFDPASGKFTSEKKEIKLTVAQNGYTPYVYGAFMYSSVKNDVKVTVGGSEYTRSMAASELPAGQSGCFTVPTADSHKGWEMTKTGRDVVANCQVKVDYIVSFTDGFCNEWLIDDKVATVRVVFYTKKYVEDLGSDEAIIENMESGFTADKVEDYKGYASLNTGEWFTADTEFYICTIAYDSNGKPGEFYKTLIKTLPTDAPIARVSNIQQATDADDGSAIWEWDVTLENGAVKYYNYVTENENYYAYDEHFMAYYSHYWITSGQLTTTYDWTGVQLPREGSKLLVLTWAVDANNAMGNYYAGKSASTRAAGAADAAPAQHGRHGMPCAGQRAMMPQMPTGELRLVKRSW